MKKKTFCYGYVPYVSRWEAWHKGLSIRGHCIPKRILTG